MRLHPSHPSFASGLSPASLWIFLGLLASASVSSSEPDDLRPLREGLQVLDATGGIHSLEPHADQAARVYVFLTGECPISKSYLPLLNRLAAGWSEAPGAASLLGIWADPTSRPSEVARFAAEYKVLFPLLLDRDGELGRRFQPTHVPEAFVLDADGHVAYRGRIDDTYPELGRRRPAPTTNDLVEAVSSLVKAPLTPAGRTEAPGSDQRPAPTVRTAPVGCLYEAPPTAEVSPAPATVTYARDVAPILLANCLVCHREGEVGPFPLATYLDAAKRARQIAQVVEQGLMPPWKAAETHGEFKGQRTLTRRQVEVLEAWAAGERAEGDPSELPTPPQFPAGWRLGPPDLVLEMPGAFEVPAEGSDVYQNFVLPTDLPEDKLVAAADFIPGNPQVVHHALFFLDSNGAARKLDAKTPGPGYSSFGNPGFVPTGSVGGWSPGKTPHRLPDGLGRHLKKGSDLVLQVHYHPAGKPEQDRSRIGLYFVKSPKNTAFAIWASAFTHDIPPGERRYRVTASFTLPHPVTLLGCVPHMHLLGREMTAVAVLPDGTEKPLIHIPKWDFNWQDEYHFARPPLLPAGTRLDVEAFYDNSTENPSNPSTPPRRVTWGEATTDEMLYCFFLVSTEDPRNIPTILRAVVTREVLGKAAARLLR